MTRHEQARQDHAAEGHTTIPSITIHIKMRGDRVVIHASGHPNLLDALRLLAPVSTLATTVRDALTNVAPHVLSLTKIVPPTTKARTDSAAWD